MTDAKPYSKEQQLSRGPKKYRRKVASPKQWQALQAAKCFDACRITGVPAPPQGHDPHHVVARVHGGADVAENIVGLERGAHDLVERRDPAACRLLLERLTDAEYAYMVETGGEYYAERHYGIAYERIGKGAA